ncbi:hypothetical protein [Dietzia sp. 179-F 9C3 NHS]|uniref:hypothetical protein n=1 Tax=Dietzia sp. 179-F 9C3 NHS TaxID=3374295 RepID=UPI003879CFBB
MTTRNWQVHADLAAPRDADVLYRVLDSVPGSTLVEFGDGSAEASMIIDADTAEEATLFVRLLLLELGLTMTGLSVTETGPDPDEAPFAPLDLAEPHAARAAAFAQDLARPVPALA